MKRVLAGDRTRGSGIHAVERAVGDKMRHEWLGDADAPEEVCGNWEECFDVEGGGHGCCVPAYDIGDVG